MTVKASILISSHNRLPLLRRALWAIATRPPTVPFEVVLCDDGSEDNILGLLRDEFPASFPWKFIRVNTQAFEKETGVKRFFNNPAWTNNVAFRHSRGEYVYLMGNEIIAWDKAFSTLMNHAPIVHTMKAGSVLKPWLMFSTTYDLDQKWLDRLDSYGSNLTQTIVDACALRPLHSEHYRSDVTNYLSLCPRSLWERIGGYDERYLGGISSDDSDFVRRARAYGAKTHIVPTAISLHQYHQGKTTYYDPPPSVITPERWKQGVENNHAIYHAWDGTYHNPQGWVWGNVGVLEVVDNFTPIKVPPLITSAVYEEQKL